MKKRVALVTLAVVAILVGLTYFYPEAQTARACLCEPWSGFCC
jgi:hypothetical protein